MALVLLLLGGSGCAAPSLTVTVPLIETLQIADPATPRREIDRTLNQRADAFAARHPDARAWKGQGLSMQPLIPPRRLDRYRKIPYPELKAGQVVLFTGRQGQLVAHALVKFTRQGWLTTGVNPRSKIDPTRVTTINYIGVVTAAFTASLPPRSSSLAP
ncbi:MAG: hypothetical protein J6386_10740 [Candidatus Synoicihabitans palmerolidicus]|nr:hypothetical protein [Candidatus Synoicihabitans palmerolidicus]